MTIKEEYPVLEKIPYAPYIDAILEFLLHDWVNKEYKLKDRGNRITMERFSKILK